MANHQIEVTFTPAGHFTYSSSSEKVKHKDTIQWRCKQYAITDVSFYQPDPTHGGHAHAPANTWTNKLTLSGDSGDHAGDHHGYSMTINGRTDDPEIIFSDDGTEGEFKSSFPDPALIATAAEAAWENVYKKLTATPVTKGASAIQLYPHGITDIEVSVGFAGVTISVKVSGPDS